MTNTLLHLRHALEERYVIERELGHGGMATVYLAQDRRHQRPVAVKVLRPELAQALGTERFLREIRIAAQLTHPHILAVHDSDESNGVLYYVMPYIDGESLRARLQREKQLPVDEALRLAREVADALSYAHARGIVHRDIKPENILLAGSHALVADFGIAALIEQDPSAEKLTETGVTLGTPAYMSPEQVSGERELDGRSDVFSLGCVLYEMLAGEPPFTGPTMQVILAKRFSSSPPAIRQTRPAVPATVGHALSRALAVVPADRFQTAAKFAEALAGDGTSRSPDAPSAHAGTGALVKPSRSRFGGRSTRIALAVVSALVALAVWWGMADRFRARPIAPASPTAVAVLPFTVRGSEQLGYLGDGMVNLLSTKLDGAGELRSVDPHAVLAVVARSGGETLGPSEARAVASRLGAGLFVLGDVLEAGGKVHLSASLYDLSDSSSALAQASVEGSAAEVFGLVDQLTTQLLARRGAGLSAPVGSISSVTTRSLPALKAYLEGESYFRGGHFTSAVEAFQRAVAMDSTFALASYRLSVAAEWSGEPEISMRAAEQAFRFGGRMSNHDRRLLDAFLAFRRGSAAEAEGLYRSIIGVYPNDLEAWMQLGEVLFHFGPLLSGRSVSESREAFERVLSVEPEHVGALWHLARVAAVEGQRAELDTLVRKAIALSPEGDRALEMDALRAFALADVQAQNRVLYALRRAGDFTAVTSAWGVAVYADQGAGGRRVVEVLTAPSRSPRVRATGHVYLAHLMLAEGRWKSAKAELAKAKNLDYALGIEYDGLLTLFTWLPVAAGEMRAIRDELGLWDATGIRPSGGSDIFDVHVGAHSHLRQYLLGLLNSRLRDHAAALRNVVVLERLGGSPDVTALAGNLVHTVRAQTMLARSRPAAALAEHERSIFRPSWYAAANNSAFFSQAHDRYMRAEILRTVGRYDEALRWYSTFAQHSLYDLVHVAPAHIQKAAIYERLGQTPKAIEHYERFLDLWKDCDPELQPMVNDARARLASLREKR